MTTRPIRCLSTLSSADWLAPRPLPISMRPPPLLEPAQPALPTTTPTFAGFPLGVTSGSYNNTLDLTLASSYNPAYITANGGTTATAEAALAAAIASGRAYLNIHSSVFGGGEIRGFLIRCQSLARLPCWDWVVWAWPCLPGRADAQASFEPQIRFERIESAKFKNFALF